LSTVLPCGRPAMSVTTRVSKPDRSAVTTWSAVTAVMSAPKALRSVSK
jgi:hypothetical protein